MDSFELNKIAGAVIAALLVIVASRTLIDISTTGHDEHGEKIIGYQLPSPEGAAETPESADAAGQTDGEGEAGATEAKAPEPAGFDAAAVVAAAASADAGKGEKVFRGCKACHSAEDGGAHKVGPALWGIVDRPKGGADGYGKYSAALAGKGGNWGLEELAGFLHNPKEYLPGTKMVYRGVKKDSDLADLLAYLGTLK